MKYGKYRIKFEELLTKECSRLKLWTQDKIAVTILAITWNRDLKFAIHLSRSQLNFFLMRFLTQNSNLSAGPLNFSQPQLALSFMSLPQSSFKENNSHEFIFLLYISNELEERSTLFKSIWLWPCSFNSTLIMVTSLSKQCHILVYDP